jgi:hypothetical protein
VTHHATGRFWQHYRALPKEVRDQADKQFALLKANPSHPSLHFKKVGNLWSARVNLNTRTLAAQDGDNFIWFWIGPHTEYERLIRK